MIYIENKNCKFKKETAQLKEIMKDFPKCGIRWIEPRTTPCKLSVLRRWTDRAGIQW